MDIKVFSLRLAKLRLKNGASARDMSLSIGQNPGYINSIESGKALPSLSGFFYICEFLRITPSEFFDLESTNPTKAHELLDYAKRLDDRQLDCLIEIVKDLNK